MPSKNTKPQDCFVNNKLNPQEHITTYVSEWLKLR